jgi:hypothetical protein
VALCRSWVNRRWPSSYGVNAHSVTLDFSPPLTDILPLIDIPLLPACWPSPRPYPSLCWFPMWPTLPLSLYLYSLLFPTVGQSAATCWRQFSARGRWRRYVPPKRRFSQDLHSATSQKTTFFIATAVKTSNHTWLRISQPADWLLASYGRSCPIELRSATKHYVPTIVDTNNMWTSHATHHLLQNLGWQIWSQRTLAV